MLLNVLYKIIRKFLYIVRTRFEKLLTVLSFKGNDVSFSSFRTNGIPYIMVARGGRFSLGKNFAMNNGIKGNPIGCYERCTFFVDREAVLTIGDNVGMSQAALVCHKSITIGDNVKIGGGVCIYDTDFHSLDSEVRLNGDTDIKSKPVVIGKRVFVGGHSIILKGVSIGDDAVIGAGSVVAKNVPSGEIWAGNPAKFIRKVKTDK